MLDRANSRVQVFESNGTFVRKWSHSPLTGVTVDGSGNVLVPGSFYIQVYTAQGTAVRQFGSGSFSSVAALPNGKYAAVESAANRVSIFAADGTLERTWGTPGSAAGQLAQPAAVGATSDGRVVVVDTGNARVQIFTENGVFESQFGKYGGAGDGFGNWSPWVDVDSAGRIYVAGQESGYPDVQIFSPDGTPVDQLYFRAQRTSTFRIGPDDRMYIGGNRGIDIRERSGALVRNIGGSIGGTGDGQFDVNGNSPAVAVDTNGDIYATDDLNGRVQVFNANGVFLRKFGATGTGPGQLSRPTGIAFTPEGRVAVSDTQYKSYFTKAGEFVERKPLSAQLIAIGADRIDYLHTSESTLFISPAGVFCAGLNPRTGSLYVLDGTTHRLQVWRRGFRTVGDQPARLAPMPAVRSTARRTNGYIDIDYSVTDGDSATVTTALAAFPGGSYLLRDMIPVPASALVEGTAAKIGAGVATGMMHRVTWNPASAALPAGKLVFEVYARDDRPSVLDMEFTTLPTTPALTISRIPFTHADLRAAWAWLILNGEPGLTRDTSGEIAGPGGAFTTSVGTETRTTAAGRAWLFAKLGVREATTSEVAAARLATAATTPNQFATSGSQRMGDRPSLVNEWSIDTKNYDGAEVWWVVRLP